MATNSANALMKEMQKIASNAQVQVQKLANQATEKSFKYNAQEAATAREFNSKEAAISRQWQTEMSNTSHQREVADLVKAGLNPVLSANSGAQSYTTSSASAQAASSNANDPSASVGALAGQLMQGKIGAYQADTSASATRAAAASTASAARYAANQAASAQRYAAALSYDQAIKKQANDLEIAKINKEAKIEASANSIGGIINKSLNKAGAYDLLGSNTVKGIVGKAKLLLNDPQKFIKEVPQGGRIIVSSLNNKGLNLIDKTLKSMNINTTRNNRQLLLDSFLLGSSSSFFSLIRKIPHKQPIKHRYTGVQE